MPDATFRSRMNGDPVVRSMLEEDETAYCSWKTLRLFIGSWNVNGRQDPLLKLDDWIEPPKGETLADIYVFGYVAAFFKKCFTLLMGTTLKVWHFYLISF